MRRVSIALVGILSALLLWVAPGQAAKETTAPPVSKVNFHWLNSWDLAVSQAKKTGRMIMIYFSGSDWEPWTQKLEKDVLSTDVFRQWANDNVIPLQVDFPKEKKVNGITKQQNDRLKLQYTVTKVPIFVFTDASGAPMSRCSYEDIRLREEEQKGQPKLAIDFLTNLVKNRPKEEILKSQPDFTAGRLYAKKNFAVLVMAISQGSASTVMQQRDELLKHQLFVRFMNHNTIFLNMNWPDDTDTSAAAKDFRAFAERDKLTPAPFQLVLWDVPYDKIKVRYRSFSLQHVDQLIKKIELELPHVDYSGAWITDYQLARTIAFQTDRDILMAFTCMDAGDMGEWSHKMNDELFRTDAFKDYAKKRFVLLQLDYPQATSQPAALADQNKMLAEQFNIRGYPTVFVVNPKGEMIFGPQKYIRGGADVFMKGLIPIVEKDADRLAALKEND